MWRLTDEQARLRDEIREIVVRDIQPRVRTMEESCEYPRDLYEVMARNKLLGLGFPAEHGGRCSSETSWCAWVEELAKVSGTVSLMAAYVKLTSLPLLLAGSEEQQRRIIPALIAGERLGSFALSEPNVGSDPAGLETRAERRGDVWILNGAKRFIGNAGLSDVYIVFARTGEAGPGGVSAFIVDGHAPGVSAERLRTMGMPGWPLGAPRFEDVEVPAGNLIGREGDGFRIAMATFDRSRPTVAAQAVGLAQGAIDLALDYAVRRHSFGHPLMDHQGIQFKLADMETEVAAARALTFQAASAIDDDDPHLTKLASMAKLFASDTAMRVTTEAVQVLGGNGYLKDFPAERMMRDAKVLQIYEGANEIQRLVVARQLAQEAAGREPVWPECMPGAEGVEAGQGAPDPGAGPKDDRKVGAMA
jgi:alkylation response protein AidB-like acyl-CoA dehydrogenase